MPFPLVRSLSAGPKPGPAVPSDSVLPGSIRVILWEDEPSLDQGSDARSSYVETFWLPSLGPSATWLLRRLVEEAESTSNGVDLDLDVLATRLGLRMSKSRHAPLLRAFSRCVRFGLARWVETEVLAVRRTVPLVPRRQLLRYPIALQEEHRRWEAATTMPDGELIRRRARLLALDLRELRVDVACIERELLRRGVHPAIAFDAARWAWSRSAPDTGPLPDGRPA